MCTNNVKKLAESLRKDGGSGRSPTVHLVAMPACLCMQADDLRPSRSNLHSEVSRHHLGQSTSMASSCSREAICYRAPAWEENQIRNTQKSSKPEGRGERSYLQGSPNRTTLAPPSPRTVARQSS
jgi:hypothetical protein